MRCSSRPVRASAQKKYNVSQRVIDVLMAYLILHFPLLKEANPNVPDVKRLETYVLESGSTLADLLAWSTHLATLPVQRYIWKKKKKMMMKRGRRTSKQAKHRV